MATTTELTQYGITWEFSAPVEYGQYITGDYWIQDTGGGINVISITPGSTDTAGRIINGSMKNPDPSLEDEQGFDNSISVLTYTASLNAARPGGNDLSSGNPLSLVAGDSLVSSISVGTADQRPQLSDAAVLTVVSTIQPAGQFRPAYCHGTESYNYNISQLQTSELPALDTVASTPSMATVEAYFERPWIDFLTGWNGRHIHPANNMPDFAREMCIQESTAALLLVSDFTEAEKETLLIRFVQLGIDNYGVIQAGGTSLWSPDGAHGNGKKFPIVFAGLMLNESSMLNIGPGDGTGDAYFGEDAQTFYVTQTEVDATASGSWNPDYRSENAQAYSEAMIDMPEWGLRHATDIYRDDASWDCTYRETSFVGMQGMLHAAMHLELQSAWDHPALFDYLDRFVVIRADEAYTPEVAAQSDTVTTPTTYFDAMWVAYRDDVPTGSGESGGEGGTIVSDQNFNFDDGTFSGWTDTQGANASIAVNSTAALNGSDNGVELNYATENNQDTYITVTLDEAYSDIFYRFKLYIPTGSEMSYNTKLIRFIMFCQSAYYNSRGNIELYYNDGWYIRDSLGQNAVAIDYDTEYTIQVRFLQDASAGGFQVWIDESLEIDDLNYDTSASTIQHIVMGSYYQSGTVVAGSSVYFDEIDIASEYMTPSEDSGSNTAIVNILHWFKIKKRR